ncbi:MAG: HD domain-containing protein [Deltaproteobacteria bacterium]|nr:HD domain-containing protein [Deltaproteobacteria bacterium]
MDARLRNSIVLRLALLALGLATLAGLGVFAYQKGQTDDQVVSLALAESEGLVSHVGTLATAGPTDYARRAVADHLLAEHVAKGHFVVIELYDLQRRKMVEAQHPEFLELKRVVDRHPHLSLLGEELAHLRLSVAGEEFVQVFAPLRDDGKVIAWFEGVYRIEPAALRSMRLGMALSVGLVALAILAAAVALYPLILRLNRHALQATDDLAVANLGMLAALGSAVAMRDRGTNSHNFRVTLYAIRLAEAVGLPAWRIQGLVKGAFLHDVGKIGIADAILHKAGPLTDGEVARMRSHVHHGVEIVRPYEWLQDALPVVRSHHERYDGTGYPEGLRGGDIPVEARIFTLVDVFDALTSRRAYKEPASLEEALRLLAEGRGSHFDPRLHDTFRSIAPGLYQTVYLVDERTLVRTLDAELARYFRTQTHRRPPPPPPGEPRSGEPLEQLDYLSGSWPLAGDSR